MRTIPRTFNQVHPVVVRVAQGLLALMLTVMPVASTLGQTPETAGTPDTHSFRLVAQVSSEQWAELASALGTPAAGSVFTNPELLETLKYGGYIIYFRHAITDSSQTDSDLSDLTNCDAQRNLTEEGRDQARLIGASIAELRIPIGEVFSSELCRARETAELAFGHVTPTPDLSAYGTADSESEASERIKALQRLLSKPPASGTNTILVGHQYNIGDAAGVNLAEGEAAIFLPTDVAT